MSFLLDTCTVSETTRRQPAKRVIQWLESTGNERMYVSVLTLGELERGICRLELSQQRARLTNWLEQDFRVRFFGSRILPIDERIALAWGRMLADAERQGKRPPYIDGLIAATALAHDLVVVTRNVADMRACGVKVFDPWNEA